MEPSGGHDSFADMTEHVPITNVPTRVKLRVEDYLSLDRNGAFEGYGKTELIDGEVTQHRPHALAKMRCMIRCATVFALLARHCTSWWKLARLGPRLTCPNPICFSRPNRAGPVRSLAPVSRW